MTEPEVHPKKYFDQIEVFGSMEKRSWIHGPKSPKRFFINEPKCPVAISVFMDLVYSS